MKFKPTLGTDLTGKLGGIVASHNSYGAYFRRLAKPVNPKTPGQQAQRTAFATVTQTWRSLTDALRLGWQTAATLAPHKAKNGSTNILSGQAYFMLVNVLRQRLDLDIVLVAPTSTSIPAVTDPGFIVHADDSVEAVLNPLDDWNAEGGGLIISVSALLSSGRSYTGTFFAIASPGAQAHGPQSSANFALPFDCRAGGKLTFQVRAVTPDGRISARQLYSVAVDPANVALSATVHAPKTIAVDFSAPILPAAILPANVTLTVAGVGKVATAVAALSPTRLSFTSSLWADSPVGGVLEVSAAFPDDTRVPFSIIVD